MAEGGGRTFSDLVRKGALGELEAWGHFRVFSPEKSGTQSTDLFETRGELTWKEVDGEKTVKAQVAATGYQDSDLPMGSVDIAGCVSRRSSHLQVISLGVLMTWPLWSLDIKNAFLQADGFERKVNLRAPCV